MCTCSGTRSLALACQPARSRTQHDLLGRTRTCLAGKGVQFDFEERDAAGGGTVEDGASGGGMDKANEIVPVVAVLHR